MKSEYNDLSEDEIDKIVESIEDKILEPHINQITGSDVGKEYKEILKNKNQELWLSQYQEQQP
jgi:transcriptional regulator NrdR family protein